MSSVYMDGNTDFSQYIKKLRDAGAKYVIGDKNLITYYGLHISPKTLERADIVVVTPFTIAVFTKDGNALATGTLQNVTLPDVKEEEKSE